MSAQPRLNIKRIKAFAALVANMPTEKPLNFYSFTNGSGVEIVQWEMYPHYRAPNVVEFFFFAMIHNYGFWHDDGTHYVGPVFGKWDGKDGVKGSDLLWKMLKCAWDKDHDVFQPERCATMTNEQFGAIFSDDNGPIPFFNTEGRIRLTRDYGRWFRTRRMAGQSPSQLVQYASQHKDAVSALRDILTHPENGVPGLYEDPLGKKAELLLMALAHRPDQLLHADANTEWNPIIDYHNMRVFLRTGCVVLPKKWMEENIDRRMTTREREYAVRKACFRAMCLIRDLSGRNIPSLDLLVWMARRYCPEMTVPNCGACLLQSVCAKKVDLFQSVRRLTFH